MQIARHRGMKKAVVALARRLAVIMHRIWVEQGSSGSAGWRGSWVNYCEHRTKRIECPDRKIAAALNARRVLTQGRSFSRYAQPHDAEAVQWTAKVMDWRQMPD
jgi:hypothetical protein